MKRIANFFGVAMLALLATSAYAQIDDEADRDQWVADGPSQWLDDDNWEDGAGPSGSPDLDFSRWGLINNGGTAIVSEAAATGALQLQRGTVEIESDGSLKVGATDFTSGSTTVGPLGELNVLGGLESVNLVNQNELFIASGADVKVSGNFESSGNLVLGVSGSESGKLTVAGNVTLNGPILANFESNPKFGDRFEFISGASGVNVTGEATVAIPEDLSIERGLGIQLLTTSGSASIEVRSIPILQIDRTDGGAEILNVQGDPAQITGYSIFSDNGLLSQENWSSLNSQNASGWREVNPRDAALAEVNLDAAVTAGDSNVAIGTPFVFDAGAHPTEEDIRFEVSLEDGSVLNGIVEYVGPPNDLTLRVDPTTGEAEISHQSPYVDPVDLIAYSVVSESGSLKADGWSSLVDSGDAAWQEANPTASHLSELSLSGSMSFSNGTEFALGSIFDTAAKQDLVFEFATTSSEKITGTVVYESLDAGGGATSPGCMPVNELLGDLDGSGDVGFLDFLGLANNFGQQTDRYSDGDIDCSGDVGFLDFLALANNFGKSLGATASAESVPEPTGGLLLSLALFGGLVCRRRR